MSQKFVNKSDALRGGDLYTDAAYGYDARRMCVWPENLVSTESPLRGPNPQAVLIARKEEIPRVVGEQLSELQQLRAELRQANGKISVLENNVKQATDRGDSWKKAHQENFTELFAYRMKYGLMKKAKTVDLTPPVNVFPVSAQSLNWFQEPRWFPYGALPSTRSTDERLRDLETKVYAPPVTPSPVTLEEVRRIAKDEVVKTFKSVTFTVEK